MADEREVFTIIEESTGEGAGLVKAVDAVTASAAHDSVPSLVFKDSSGNMVRPQLNSDGTIPVTVGAAGVCYDNRGENAGTLTEAIITTLTLVVNKTYSKIEYNGSCLHASLFQVIFDNDGAETVLADFIVGPGDYTHSQKLECVEFTAGATGTQRLLLKAKNLRRTSTLRGTIALLEAP